MAQACCAEQGLIAHERSIGLRPEHDTMLAAGQREAARISAARQLELSQRRGGGMLRKTSPRTPALGDMSGGRAAGAPPTLQPATTRGTRATSERHEGAAGLLLHLS